MTKTKLGSGVRFKALSKKLGGRGVTHPDALAAFIGRRNFGDKKFSALSAAARRKK